MPKTRAPDPKVDALRQQASLNPYPQRVSDPLFASSDFFDRRDLVQVKYEMVRRVRAEGQPIAQSAKAFGLSRPSFYQAQAALEREGLSGLLAKKRGPRRSHKLGAQVMGFVQALLSQEPSLSSSALAARIRQRFKLQVHSRSIERALVRQEKKRR
jgi:transposase